MPIQEERFKEWMQKHGEGKAVKAISIMSRKIGDVFKEASGFLNTQQDRENILATKRKLLDANIGLADDLIGMVEKTGTKSAAIPGIAELTGPLIELLTTVSSIGFIFYKYKQKRSNAFIELAHYNEILNSHVYVDLLKRYLENNKTRYTTVGEFKLENVIKDFTEEVAVLFYIQHACLINVLSEKDIEQFIDFFVTCIVKCAKETPTALYATQHAFVSYKNEPVEALLNVMFNTAQGFGNDLTRTDLGGKHPGDNHYDIKYYFCFADRLKLNLSTHEESKIVCTSFSAKVPEELITVRLGRFNKEKHIVSKEDAQIEKYPAMILFNPVEGMYSGYNSGCDDFKDLGKPERQSTNMTMAANIVTVYLSYQLLESIQKFTEKLDSLNKTVIESKAVIILNLSETIKSMSNKIEELLKSQELVTKNGLKFIIEQQQEVIKIATSVKLLEQEINEALSKQKELIIRKAALYEEDPECNSDGEEKLTPAELEFKSKNLSTKHARACYLTAMYDDKSKRLFARAQTKKTENDLVKIKANLKIE